MEAFGAISSALSILDVAIRTSNAIHELICEWRDVPIEIIVLSNEINDSRAVLIQAYNLVQRIHATPATQSDLGACAVAIENQVEQAKPIWNKLHLLMKEFKDEDNAANKMTRTAKFRWLKNRSKVESLRTTLKEKRLNIMQFMITSSAFQNHAIEMQLVCISADIKAGQNMVIESEKLLHQKLKDIDHQMTLMSKTQEHGAQELASFFGIYDRSSSPNYSDDCCTLMQSKTDILPVENHPSTKFPNRYIMNSSNTKGLDLTDVGTNSRSMYYFTFEQRAISCDINCQCICHSRSWSVNTRLGTSKLFKRVFGSLLLGYSNSPTPKAACDMKMCSRSSQGSSLTIRYVFPAWFTNRVIFSMFSSHLNRHSNFIFRIARRIPYEPGNIFSKINSRDFSGAIELLQNGEACINDIEARHGTSILGAALRSPVLSPGLIRFIEYLLQKQVNPYLENDEGESAWHFALRLMLPKIPTSISSARLQSQLHRLFPNPDWDIFQFTHIHKVVVGLRPINLAKELENPKYLAQVNAKDSLGQTPLGLAATLGDSEAVESLLLAGADPNTHAKSMTSFHPLRKAVRAQNARCVKLLLIASADPFVLDNRGANVLHTAAAKCDDLAIITSLLLAGLPLDGRNVHNCTPLSFTPLKDNVNVAHFLLSHGADINNIDKDGDTPLTESIRLNAHNCLELFLSKCANYQMVNKRGRTILHFAAAHADVTTLDILVSYQLYGLDIQAKDARGKTPMECLLERQFIPKEMMVAFSRLLQSVSGEGVSPKPTKATSISATMQVASIKCASVKIDTLFNWNSLLFLTKLVALDNWLLHGILIIILFIVAYFVVIVLLLMKNICKSYSFSETSQGEMIN